MLAISCEHCGHEICRYQKDGPGSLKRMYIDRMEPNSHEETLLACVECARVIGTKIIYEKENRPAYRLFVGAVTKKIIKKTEK